MRSVSRNLATAIVLVLAMASANAQPRTDADPLPAGAIARFGSARFAHGDRLTGLSLSPDGAVMLAADSKRIVLMGHFERPRIARVHRIGLRPLRRAFTRWKAGRRHLRRHRLHLGFKNRKRTAPIRFERRAFHDDVRVVKGRQMDLVLCERSNPSLGCG